MTLILHCCSLQSLQRPSRKNCENFLDRFGLAIHPCSIVHCTTVFRRRYCTVLYCTALFSLAQKFYSTAIHSTPLMATIVIESTWNHTAAYCTVLYCTGTMPSSV